MDANLINEFFLNGGTVGFGEDGTITYFVEKTNTWFTLDKTMQDFFGDRGLDEVAGTEEFEEMLYYIALKWKEEVEKTETE